MFRIGLQTSSRSGRRRQLRGLQAALHDQLREVDDDLHRPSPPSSASSLSSEQLEGRRTQERPSSCRPQAQRPRSATAVLLPAHNGRQVRGGRREIPNRFVEHPAARGRIEARRDRSDPAPRHLHELPGRVDDGDGQEGHAEDFD